MNKISSLLLSPLMLLIGCGLPVVKKKAEVQKLHDVTVPTEAELRFKNSDEASNYLNLKLFDGTICASKSCLFADLEPSLFQKIQIDYVATEDFLKKLSITSTSALPTSKAILVKEKTASFDPSNSIVYGGFDRILELGLDKKCSSALELDNGSYLGADSLYDGMIEESSETLSEAKIERFPVYLDLKILGKAQGGIIPEGSDIKVTYKTSEVLGSMKADYIDYESVKGRFKLTQEQFVLDSRLQRVWESVKVFFKMAVAYAALNKHPRGYPLPATGYGGDAEAFIPNAFECSQDAPTTQECKTMSSAEACANGHPSACDTDEDWTECRDISWKPVSEYYPRQRSKRIYTGPGTIDCRAQFPGITEFYKIKESWVVSSSNIQWFIADKNWPNCSGLSCPDKFMRASAGDDRRMDAEPYYNHCIDRWTGLDFDAYIKTIKAECENTEVYRKAYDAKIKSDADEAFGTKCREDSGCKEAVLNFAQITEKYPIEAIVAKLDAEEKALKEAKDTEKSYLINDPILQKSSHRELSEYIEAILRGLDKVEELRKSTNPQADWNGGGDKIHRQGIITGFSNYSESKSTIEQYTKIAERISSLTSPIAIEVGCSYSSVGRFRKYVASELNGLKIKAGEPKSTTVKLINAYEAK